MKGNYCCSFSDFQRQKNEKQFTKIEQKLGTRLAKSRDTRRVEILHYDVNSISTTHCSQPLFTPSDHNHWPNALITQTSPKCHLPKWRGHLGLVGVVSGWWIYCSPHNEVSLHRSVF